MNCLQQKFPIFSSFNFKEGLIKKNYLIDKIKSIVKFIFNFINSNLNPFYKKIIVESKRESFSQLRKKTLSIPNSTESIFADSFNNADPLLLDKHEILHEWADFSFKNTLNLKDAQIVFLGEDHRYKTHKILEKFITEKFGKKDDIVLIEGVEGDLNQGDNDAYFKIYGWDDSELLNESIKIVKELVEYQENYKYYQELGLTKELIETSLKMDSLFKKIDEYSYIRNQKLINSVKKYSTQFPDSKIFVIAGKSHIINSEIKYNVLDLFPNQKCISILLKEENENVPSGFEWFQAKTSS
jgi:hypothetical protein